MNRMWQCGQRKARFTFWVWSRNEWLLVWISIDAASNHSRLIFYVVFFNDASGRAQSWIGHWRLLPGAGEQPSGHLHSQPCPGIRGQDGEQSEVRSKPGMSVNILSPYMSDTCAVTFLYVILNLCISCRNIAWIIINSISKGEMKFGWIKRTLDLGFSDFVLFGHRSSVSETSKHNSIRITVIL